MTDNQTTFPGNRFVGFSWRPGANDPTIARLRAIVANWSVCDGPGWLLASEKSHAFASNTEVALALGRARVLDRVAAKFRDADDVATILTRTGPAGADPMAPPFRAVWVERSTGIIHGAIDVFGLGQMFVSSQDGLSAISSSATLLADILGAGLCLETLAGYAAFGGFIGAETPFSGITKLLGGNRATLAEGRLAVSTRPAVDARGIDLAGSFRDAVIAMTRAAPDAELELSGGLDSRMILAAMPKALRHGRRAITIGVAGEHSSDVEVARAIADAEGLDWSFLDAGGLARLDGVGLSALLANAAVAYDHMANPLDKAALIMAGQGRTVGARFGGQNGETLRGFYYPAQPLDAKPSDILARRLVDMRLIANDAADERILGRSMRDELRAAAKDRMIRRILSLDGTWGQVLDQLYLTQRMQNWVGNTAGHRLLEHAPLYPFFDPTFVAAAMAVPPKEKLNSRIAYRMLREIDPELARIPLDNGVVPANMSTSPLAGALFDVWFDTKRVAKRLRVRFSSQGATTLGSNSVTHHWRRHGLFAQLNVDDLSRTGMFDASALASVASGQWTPDRATLGLLLVVSSLEART